MHEYLAIPSLCMIIKSNSHVRNGNVALWEVEGTTGWIPWKEMNHIDAVLIIHVIL